MTSGKSRVLGRAVAHLRNGDDSTFLTGCGKDGRWSTPGKAPGTLRCSINVSCLPGACTLPQPHRTSKDAHAFPGKAPLAGNEEETRCGQRYPPNPEQASSSGCRRAGARTHTHTALGAPPRGWHGAPTPHVAGSLRPRPAGARARGTYPGRAARAGRGAAAGAEWARRRAWRGGGLGRPGRGGGSAGPRLDGRAGAGRRGATEWPAARARSRPLSSPSRRPPGDSHRERLRGRRA